jgi:hypothetical protein
LRHWAESKIAAEWDVTVFVALFHVDRLSRKNETIGSLQRAFEVVCRWENAHRNGG